MLVFCQLMTILCCVSLVLVICNLFLEMFITNEYKRLDKKGFIDCSLDDYRELIKILKNTYCFSEFQIVYFKSNVIVLQIKNRYYLLDIETSSLIYMFNKDECLLEKILNFNYKKSAN